MTRLGIAKVDHEINKAFCEAMGDHSQPDWDNAPQWQRDSAVTGVTFNLDNPDAPPSASHESWLKQKEADGWKYGEVKDAEKKEHPCYVTYEQLPTDQKAKDYLFKQVVSSLKEYIGEPFSTTSADTMSEIQQIKAMRQEGDALVQKIKSFPVSREVALSRTNAELAVMWLGMELKRRNEPNPYPSSKDPKTGDVIEPTADGLKF